MSEQETLEELERQARREPQPVDDGAKDAGEGDSEVGGETRRRGIPPGEAPVGGELLLQIVEGALLAAGKPLTVADIAALFEEHEQPGSDAIRAALTTIGESCAGRGFELREVASGFRLQVIQSVAPWIARLWEEKPQRYSRALLETLALIAYRQPITRGDIEDIRGVAVASNIVKTLLERDWVRIVGHKDVPGRPALYATTRKFLDYFNLKNLDDLPPLAELRDLDSLNTELALEGADTPSPESVDAGDDESQTPLALSSDMSVSSAAERVDSDSDTDQTKGDVDDDAAELEQHA
jgi:segregation and condensation protein B